MRTITDEAIQQIEDLAISNACPGAGIDIQNTISRIGMFIQKDFRLFCTFNIF